jgi:hypothetical protein
MIPEAVRWYKAAGAQDCDCYSINDGYLGCIFTENLESFRGGGMPKNLNGVEYRMGWDYCAAQLEQLGCIGDAVEIYQLHRGRKARVFPQGALMRTMSLVEFHPVFSSQKRKVQLITVMVMVIEWKAVYVICTIWILRKRLFAEMRCSGLECTLMMMMKCICYRLQKKETPLLNSQSQTCAPPPCMSRARICLHTMLLTAVQIRATGHDTRSCSLVQGCRRTRLWKCILHY